MKPIVKMQHGYKSFHAQKVLQDFEFEVYENEFVALVGSSGSGKSTILNLIGLLDSLDSGKLFLFDEINIKPYSKEAQLIQRDKIGYLFQNFALVDDKSVYYNMRIAIKNLKFKDEKKLILDALKKVGLEGKENKIILECSGGEQQRVAVARLLIKPCSLILCDEPTGSLDHENKHIIFELLKTIHESGKTLIVVTHDHELASISDRVIDLDKK